MNNIIFKNLINKIMTNKKQSKDIEPILIATNVERILIKQDKNEKRYCLEKGAKLISITCPECWETIDISKGVSKCKCGWKVSFY